MLAFVALSIVLQQSGPPYEVTPTGPGIVSSQGPTYPEVARKARMYGFAVIDLSIAEDGSALVDLSFGTNPLLVAAAKRAAELWRFTESTNTGQRCATLLFEFRLEGDPDEAALNETLVETPYSLVEVARPYPSVTTILRDPPMEPCFMFSESGTVTFCEKALRLFPFR